MKERNCSYNSHPSKPGKVWHFLWHEDTWLSFVVDAVLIIIIGKFILYPLIGLALGTSFPLVAVVSDSMDHNGADFDAWWTANENKYASFNITKSDFKDYSMSNGFEKGDLMIVVHKDSYDPGDVIVYSVSERNYPIIHRVIRASSQDYSTLGDANSGQINFERSVHSGSIHGKVVLRLPYLGWVKVLFMKLFGAV